MTINLYTFFQSQLGLGLTVVSTCLVIGASIILCCKQNQTSHDRQAELVPQTPADELEQTDPERLEAHKQAALDREAREQATRDQEVREQEAREQAAREQAAREQAVREQAVREQAVREQAAREQAVREQAARDHQAALDQRAARDKQAASEEAARQLQAAALLQQPSGAAEAAEATEAEAARKEALLFRIRRQQAGGARGLSGEGAAALVNSDAFGHNPAALAREEARERSNQATAKKH